MMFSLKRYKSLIFFLSSFSILILDIFLYRKIARAAIETSFFPGATDPCTYWKAVFNFAMIIAGVLTTTIVAIAGLYYIVSLGQEEKLKKAKDIISGSISGLLLALFSWGIFNLVAPYILTCELEIPELELETGEPSLLPTNPCAGLPEDKLFATKEECEEKNEEVKGVCMESMEEKSSPEKSSGATQEEAKQSCENLGGTPGECKESTEKEGFECECATQKAEKWCYKESASEGKCGENVVNIAEDWIGQEFGPCHCAYFVSSVLEQSGCESSIYTVSATQLREKLKSLGWQRVDNPQPGDIGFKKCTGPAEHVGIYAGNGKSIHASVGAFKKAHPERVKKYDGDSGQGMEWYNGTSCKNGQKVALEPYKWECYYRKPSS